MKTKLETMAANLAVRAAKPTQEWNNEGFERAQHGDLPLLQGGVGGVGGAAASSSGTQVWRFDSFTPENKKLLRILCDDCG